MEIIQYNTITLRKTWLIELSGMVMYVNADDSLFILRLSLCVDRPSGGGATVWWAFFGWDIKREDPQEGTPLGVLVC